MGVLAVSLSLAPGAAAQGETPLTNVPALVGEAAQRFALPPAWITGVMRRESGFLPSAVSPVGAVGLMQVLPSTYRDLSRRYGLGPDPAAPRDNVLAGAAYLRELYDRFGPEGFLAAYNAGPERYGRALIDGRPLPAETRRYVGQLRLDLGFDDRSDRTGSAAPGMFAPLSAPPARDAGGLFAPVAGDGGAGPHVQ
jgi:soluble lytic murein transglycosylase-like protein